MHAQARRCAVSAQAVLLLLLACAYCVQCAAQSHVGDVVDDGEKCDEHVYASQCLASGRCHWCCEAPFGSQCFASSTRPDASNNTVASHTHHHAHVKDAPQSQLRRVQPPVSASSSAAASASTTACSAAATLTQRGQTCAQACSDAGTSCEACEQRRWCYFCITSSTCQAPDALCSGASVVQQCAVTYDDETVIAFGRRLLCGGLVMMLVSALLTSTVCAIRCYRERQFRQRMLATEQRPLLEDVDDGTAAASGGGGGGGNGNHLATTSAALSRTLSLTDDEYVCYLCLAARATVTFLPCHHTCCCETCSNRLRPNAQTLTCPFCRCAIEAMVSLLNVLCRPPNPARKRVAAAMRTVTKTTTTTTTRACNESDTARQPPQVGPQEHVNTRAATDDTTASLSTDANTVMAVVAAAVAAPAAATTTTPSSGAA